MEQLDIQASNIKCGGCVANVENSLKDIQGINEINVDIASNIVSVKGDNLNKKEIENKLSELGYL